MKVYELIRELAQFDADAEIRFVPYVDEDIVKQCAEDEAAYSDDLKYDGIRENGAFSVIMDLCS